MGGYVCYWHGMRLRRSGDLECCVGLLHYLVPWSPLVGSLWSVVVWLLCIMFGNWRPNARDEV